MASTAEASIADLRQEFEALLTYVTGPDGTPLTAHDRRPTTSFSVVGKLTFRRHAFTAPGQPVVCPLDAALSLPPRCYSDLLREWAGYGSADAAFRETQALLERILG